MKFDDLTEGQRERARACKSPEEMLALAKEEGYELSQEELDSISGGDFWDRNVTENPRCPVHCPHV